MIQSSFLLTATNKSSGKTIVSIGLASWLKQNDISVQCFKKGPDYIDSMWLTHASSRQCINLDFNTQTKDEIDECYLRYSDDADVVIVEGNKGLYDGIDVDGSDCNAALAEQLDLPVVLVVDCQGITRGIAPLLLGYTQFSEKLDFAGVILNKVASERHESKLIKAIQTYSDLRILGVLQRNADYEIEERHIGLIPSNEHHTATDWIQRAGRLIGDNIDCDRLIELTRSTQLPRSSQAIAARESHAGTRNIRLAVARDSVFGFYYADDIDRLKRTGVDISYFDCLRDRSLPAAEALFIGGGFPETHLKALEENRSLREEIRLFAENGGVIYAECGGLMYLCREISWQGQHAKMCGVFDADIILRPQAVGRGYVNVEPLATHPWPLKTQHGINGHEFHYSEIGRMDFEPEYAYKVKRGRGVDGEYDGLVYKNVLATYMHQRHTSSNPWVDAFVNFIRSKIG